VDQARQWDTLYLKTIIGARPILMKCRVCVISCEPKKLSNAELMDFHLVSIAYQKLNKKTVINTQCIYMTRYVEVFSTGI